MLNKFIVDLLFEGYVIKKNINKVAHFQIIFINFEKPLSNSKEEILMFAKFIALSGYRYFFFVAFPILKPLQDFFSLREEYSESRVSLSEHKICPA